MPAGTLTRFKRVSKHWLSLISSPSFHNSHAKRVHNKTLYICTSETHDHRLHRYRVQAIKVSNLLSFSDTATPITVYSSKSKSKSKRNVLREVAFVDDDDDLVPACMGFGVFGSRIVLVGGWFEGPKFRYASKPSYVLDTSVSEPSLVSSVIPDMEEETINEPFLQEIDGKLYALSGKIFAVFDPKTNVWASLPPLPFLNCSFHSCSVLGSKIFTTLRDHHGRYRCKTFCFDVASPHGTWTRIEPSLQFYCTDHYNYYNKHVLVLDSEDDFEKLVFTYCHGKILVHRILLSNAGEPNKIELVAWIHLPDKYPGLSKCEAKSYYCAHLGDRKVCFSFMYYLVHAKFTPVVVLTLEFAYSKSGASNPPENSSSSSSDDLIYTSICGSFSAKTLSYYMFEYNYVEEPSSVVYSNFGGCFVL